MKVKIELPGQSEAKVEVPGIEDEYEWAGETVEVTPQFWSETASPNVLFLSSLDANGNVLHRVQLRVSGSDGKIRLIDRSKRVKPACDVEKKEEKPEKRRPTVPSPGK